MSDLRFLIVRLGSLGDVIHAIPAAAALRARYPDARIDWMVDPRYIELLQLVPGLDGLIAIDPRRSKAGLLAQLWALRRRRYDAVVDLQGLIKSAALARAAGGRRTIGFPRAHLREAAARVLYTEMPDPGSATHVIHKNLGLVAALGVTDRTVSFPLRIPHKALIESVAARFAPAGYALLNPGAAWPNKRWPAGRFGALASTMRDRLGVRSLVLWGPGEESIADAVVAASDDAAERAPVTTVTDIFGIAAGARVMISGDTGPLHIGGAVGTRLVALFGPTFPQRNGPWSAADVVISRDQACVCHYERRCRRGAPCIEEITLAEVIGAVERRVGMHG